MGIWILVFSLFTSDGVFNDHIEFTSKEKCENAAQYIRKHLGPVMDTNIFRYKCFEK